MEVGGNLLYVAGLIGKWVFVLECVCGEVFWKVCPLKIFEKRGTDFQKMACEKTAPVTSTLVQIFKDQDSIQYFLNI